jgi:outer membrane receptor protein involved in Fe transport
MGTGQNAIVRADLAGSRGSDVTAANNLLASLAGFVTSYSQTFNITNRSSGFVNGAPETRNFRLDEYDVFVQDNWKLSRRVTLTLGLRWNLPGVADERDSLGLLPVIRNNDPVQTLLSNSTLDFAGGSA